MVPPPPLFKLLFSHPSSLLLFFFFCVDSCYLSSLPIHTSWQSLTLCTAKKKNYRFFSLAQEVPKRLLYRIVFGARVPLACLRLSVIVLLSQLREKEDEEININPMNVTQRQPILLLTLWDPSYTPTPTHRRLARHCFPGRPWKDIDLPQKLKRKKEKIKLMFFFLLTFRNCANAFNVGPGVDPRRPHNERNDPSSGNHNTGTTWGSSRSVRQGSRHRKVPIKNESKKQKQFNKTIN